jgi:hypothetical protein
MQAILFDRGNTLVQFGESDYEAGLKEILASLDSPEALDLAELHRFEDDFFAKIDFYREHAHLEVNLLHYYELLARYFGVRFNKPQPGQAGTKQERAIGIRILRIARIKNLMV